MSGSEINNDRYHDALLELIAKINQNSFLLPQQMKQREDANTVTVNNNSEQMSALRDKGWVEKRQGIVYAEITDYGGVFLKITAKAAGFVVGAKGSSIRAICSKTGAYTKSWLSCSSQQDTLPLRIYIVEGSAKAIYETILIMLAAVDRYTALVEGKCKDKKVNGEQIVEGIKFEYKPPPLTLMAKAARTIRPETGNNSIPENQQNTTEGVAIPYLGQRSVSEQLPWYYSPATPQGALRYNQSLSPALQQRVAQIINYNTPPINGYAAPALLPHPQVSLPLLLPQPQSWDTVPSLPMSPHPSHAYPQSPTMWYQSSPLPSPQSRTTPLQPPLPQLQATLAAQTHF